MTERFPLTLSFDSLQGSGQKVGEVLGSIFLQGATVEPYPGDAIIIKTLTGKDYPIKACKESSADSFTQWKDAIDKYSKEHYKPPPVQLVQYKPPSQFPTPLPTSATNPREVPNPPSSMEILVPPIDSDDGYLRVTVTLSDSGKENTYTIQSQCSENRASETVTKKWKEIQNIRKTLVAFYYHIIVPPLKETDPQKFFDRVSRHRILRADPALHVFLGLMKPSEAKEREKERKRSGTKSRVDTPAASEELVPEEQRKNKEEVESTLGTKYFDDPIVERCSKLKSSAVKFEQLLVDMQRYAEEMSKVDQSFTKGLEGMNKACKALGQVDNHLAGGFTSIGEVVNDIMDYRKGLTASYHFHVTLLAYVELVESMKGCIQNRMNRILDYQNTVKQANEEKMTFLTQAKEGGISVKKDNPFFGPDMPTKIKRSEEKMYSTENEVEGRRTEVEKASISYSQEMTHFHLWKLEDFKEALVAYVDEQQKYHRYALDQWDRLGSSLSKIDAHAPQNIDWIFLDPNIPIDPPAESVTYEKDDKGKQNADKGKGKEKEKEKEKEKKKEKEPKAAVVAPVVVPELGKPVSTSQPVLEQGKPMMSPQSSSDRRAGPSAPIPPSKQQSNVSQATTSPQPASSSSSSSSPQAASGAVFPKFQAKVLYDFTAKWEMELSITAGSTVMVENEHDGGWYSGYVMSDNDSEGFRRGFFPKSYVKAAD